MSLKGFIKWKTNIQEIEYRVYLITLTNQFHSI